MPNVYRRRRVVLVASILVLLGILYYGSEVVPTQSEAPVSSQKTSSNAPLADSVLSQLPIKGRAPKTAYSREEFGGGWQSSAGCDTRNIILYRDLKDIRLADGSCDVESGTLADPYTGKHVIFTRESTTSDAVQIDHVVALSDAWQKGAQQLSYERRVELANDPLELLAVYGPANQQKSDGDAATWLPPYKPFRCQYVARQIAVKQKYELWVTQAEYDAMKNILATCPDQRIPTK